LQVRTRTATLRMHAKYIELHRVNLREKSQCTDEMMEK